jgi:hypothetical protein
MKVSLVSIPVQDPILAHQIYTSKLGFISKEYDPDGNLAIVVSVDDPQGVAILLEPCEGNFAEKYQKSAYKANLPIMALEAKNMEVELKRLKAAGVKLRPELDKPKWEFKMYSKMAAEIYS